MRKREPSETGRVRYYNRGKAKVIEYICKGCRRAFWVNYTMPWSTCPDCEGFHSRSPKRGNGGANVAISKGERQYEGKNMD